MRDDPRTRGAKVIIGDAAPTIPTIPVRYLSLIVGVRSAN